MKTKKQITITEVIKAKQWFYDVKDWLIPLMENKYRYNNKFLKEHKKCCDPILIEEIKKEQKFLNNMINKFNTNDN